MKRLILAIIFLFGSVCHSFAAVGDAVADCQSIATTAVLTMQPGSGIEWIVHNVWFNDNIEIRRFDGTDTWALQLLGPDFQPFTAHLTNTSYMTVQNLAGGNRVICYDGIVSKQ